MTAILAEPDRGRLAELLREAGSPLDPDGVAALVAGVLAAPPEIGASWHALVAEPTHAVDPGIARRAVGLPWQPRQAPGEMTPGRVLDGFRRARDTVGTPASATRTTVPGPGRPKGSRNKQKAPRQPVGKTHPKAPRYAASQPKLQKTPG